jgi:NAD(P)-dependent dehydrogenase (short-subunit alcohol dehydrogenase family)
MIAMDVNDVASVRGGVAVVLAKAGRLDAVVNNAGFSMIGAVEDTDPPSQWWTPLISS